MRRKAQPRDQANNPLRHIQAHALLTILSPLVFPPDLVLLLGGEIIGDVEGLPDLLWALALDHVRDGLAADVEEGLDVEVVGGEDDLKQHLLVDLHELLVPLLDVGGLLAGVGVVVRRGGGVVLVVLAPFDDLLEDGLVDLGSVSWVPQGVLVRLWRVWGSLGG